MCKTIKTTEAIIYKKNTICCKKKIQ